MNANNKNESTYCHCSCTWLPHRSGKMPSILPLPVQCNEKISLLQQVTRKGKHQPVPPSQLALNPPRELEWPTVLHQYNADWHAFEVLEHQQRKTLHDCDSIVESVRVRQTLVQVLTLFSGGIQSFDVLPRPSHGLPYRTRLQIQIQTSHGRILLSAWRT